MRLLLGWQEEQAGPAPARRADVGAGRRRNGREELLVLFFVHGCGQLLEMPEVPRAMEAAEVAVAANALDEPK